ncbi:MAG: hypothetical protein COA54_07755 [Thiotrichaceae bacterium]|nr:MAG: hypothetical protein COA54_07755 [Thiotrichaceae bacterium]
MNTSKLKEFDKIFDKAIKDYKGNVQILETAIGALIVGQQMGWKVLLLIHDKKTIRKYEKALGINFRDHMDETGPLSHKSIAWCAVQKVSNFWKAVSGEIPGIRSPELKK